ncbi:thioesterase II family protein [Streptomyces sp. NBC_00057]|uniref:thioesterase II family protein n=1 Tax=Streptomyces sp. NBC_00057 TaxID=2975634 RepID=UPI0032520AA8
MGSEANALAQKWFRRFKPVDRPTLRLVCFPHAGGAASAFRSWPDRVPADVEVLAVRYPGRQDRFLEDCVDAMDELAGAITAALEPYVAQPLAFFGHSMGASVAYEVAARTWRAHGRGPVRLFVSSQTAPHRMRDRFAHLMDDEALVEEVRRLGGVDGEALADPDVRELVLPAIRADFKLSSGYRPEAPERLDMPVVAYVGEKDPDVTATDLAAWADVSGAGFRRHVFPGDHFYLVTEESALVADVVDHLGLPQLRR